MAGCHKEGKNAGMHEKLSPFLKEKFLTRQLLKILPVNKLIPDHWTLMIRSRNLATMTDNQLNCSQRTRI